MSRCAHQRILLRGYTQLWSNSSDVASEQPANADWYIHIHVQLETLIAAVAAMAMVATVLTTHVFMKILLLLLLLLTLLLMMLSN